VRRVCWCYNIRTIFSTASSLRGQLMQVKDRDPLGKSPMWYTKFHVAVDVCTMRGELEKPAIAEHAWNHHHQILWDDIQVFGWGSTLLLKEAVHICFTATDSLLNRDKCVAIPECWTAILRHTYPASNSTHHWWHHPILDAVFIELKRRWHLSDCYSVLVLYFYSFVLCALMKTTV